MSWRLDQEARTKGRQALAELILTSFTDGTERLAGVRARIEQRIAELNPKGVENAPSRRLLDAQGFSDMFCEHAVYKELREILAMLDRIDRGPICKVMTGEKGPSGESDPDAGSAAAGQARP